MSKFSKFKDILKISFSKETRGKLHWEVFKNEYGDFYWRVKAANNKILAVGAEPFQSRRNALKSIKTLRAYIINDTIEVKDSEFKVF